MNDRPLPHPDDNPPPRVGRNEENVMKAKDKRRVVASSLALLIVGVAMMFHDFALGTVIAMPGFVCLLGLAK